MSWASLWSKAKENHARSRKASAIGRVFMIGAIFVGAGVYNLYSDVNHYIHGRPATATLMAHLKLCTVEYQRIGEERRKDRVTCEFAEEFQRRVGSNKVKLGRENVARVQFQLEDGRLQEADIDDVKLGSYGRTVGTTLPVVYAPDNPVDVRARMSWQTIKVPLILIAIGMPFLMLCFGASPFSLFHRLFRRRQEETASASSGQPAQVSGIDSKLVQRIEAAQTALDGYSTRKGNAPRTSFGLRNQ